MQHFTINSARKNFDNIVNSVVKHDETASIVTDDGEVILVNKQEWSGMLETMYLYSIPGMVESILESDAEPLEDCISIEELFADV
ncbi:MAG: type II toxin-antitoxin system Phd/YefM family antitoxin [Firmicutes bacterium]|nr:type II toxin-antitoxin system Phd/YefM family antitoxin [Bacillota bacterium]